MPGLQPGRFQEKAKIRPPRHKATKAFLSRTNPASRGRGPGKGGSRTGPTLADEQGEHKVRAVRLRFVVYANTDGART